MFIRIFTILIYLPLVLSHDIYGSINLWPDTAPNETQGFVGPEVKQQDGDQIGCGIHRDSSCDEILNVTTPTLTPYLVSNGTGAAVIIAPGVISLSLYIYIYIYIVSSSTN